MKNKNKLVGKIITIIFLLLVPVIMFTPLLSFETSASGAGSETTGTLAKYVTPMHILKAHFSTEEDLAAAEENFKAIQDNYDEAVAKGDIERESANDNIAATEEAAIYYSMFFAQEEELLPNFDEPDTYINMISSINLYSYFVMAVIATTIALLVMLVLRCIKPRNRGFIITGNLLSILLLLLSIASLFIVIPMTLTTSATILSTTISYSINAYPNLIFVGIFIVVSLITMILTLTTKGVRRAKTV